MVSVVVINHDTFDITTKCLQNLYKSRGVDLEVILINNTPEDKLSPAARKKWPKTRIIDNKIRLGFAANNNQGMKAARGEYILLLNSDAFVYPDTIAACLTALRENKADVLGCRLTYEDGRTQQSWGFFPTLRRVVMIMSFVDNLPLVRKFADSIHARDLSRYTQTREVDWIQGAFVFLKKQVYKNTGGFDENLHMYTEEVEWEYRINQAGYKIIYFPGVSCIHLVGESVKNVSKMFVSEMEGFRYFFKQHRPKWEQWLLPWVQIAGVLIRIPAWAVWGKWHLVKAYVQVLPRLL